MFSLQQWDVRLDRSRLKNRSFLLGNKHAFSLTLPAACGTTPASLHRHKWFGAYHYGRKFFESQGVRLPEHRNVLLCIENQTGLLASLTDTTREYVVDGCTCSETYFVPDGLQAFACTLSGETTFAVEPEFDIRFYRALNHTAHGYEVEPIENGVLVSGVLPSGTYDDRAETFLPDESGSTGPRLYAAVQAMGDGVDAEILPTAHRSRRKIFHQDRKRERFLACIAGEDASDHAPLWNQSTSRVFLPCRLTLPNGGTVLYGFGASREEALAQLAALRDGVDTLRATKAEAAGRILSRGAIATGVPDLDTAYGQVLHRLMDALVARHVIAEDTVLQGPATMILAGNQYFHDSWKRDENIALGFLLTLGFHDLARDVIHDTWQLQDPVSGRLPQRLRAGEEPPYHSSDGTLWALWRLHQYWRVTGDDSLLREKLPMVRCFFERSLERCVEGMLPSGRTTSPEYLWETWMDTPHTPRDGFPVEIQMLWIVNLRAYRPLFQNSHPEFEAALECAEAAAWRSLARFTTRGIPADSLDDRGEVRDFITPNPYFCFGVGLDMGDDVECAMRHVGRRQLAGRQGIVTLAPQDWDRVFPREFLQDRKHVRGKRMASVGKLNYHRGVEWNWLSQFFVSAELKYGEPDAAYATYLRGQMLAALRHGGIGGISELHDLSGPRGPEYQAWSMAGFLEAVHAFAGVQIDVPQRRIGIRPRIPSTWPGFSVRKWYGTIPFDVACRHTVDRRTLEVRFQDFPPADVEMEIRILVRRGYLPATVDLCLDDVARLTPWRVEALSGTRHSELVLSVPAATRISLDVKLERVSTRKRRIA